jgi:hypothetical protein
MSLLDGAGDFVKCPAALLLRIILHNQAILAGITHFFLKIALPVTDTILNVRV